MNNLNPSESEKQMQERQHRMQVNALIQESEAPARHLKFLDVDSSGAWGEKYRMLLALIGKGFLVGICGERGNGKTQLGVDLMSEVMENNRSSFYMTAIGFFSRIKASYRRESCESERDIIDMLRYPKLLVIDEIGKRSDTEWENNLLFELVNHRYNDLTDTLLIDNRKKEEFLNTLGPSLSSRMMETGGVIEANWESFRK